MVRKNSKVDGIRKKMEEAKREFYDYIDDDIRPLSILWTPCVNWFWSGKGKAKEYQSFGWSSVNCLLRFLIMYDIQIAESNFFLSPGIGWANQDYTFF